MPEQRCPKCRHADPVWLEGLSRSSYVEYYRCAGCGHVWNVPKGRPEGPVWDVTVDRAPVSLRQAG